MVLNIYDKYIGMNTLTEDDITLQIYNESTKKYENIPEVKANITSKYIENGIEITYEVTNLERDFVEKYSNYSGYISAIISANKIFDTSGNGNDKKIIK